MVHDLVVAGRHARLRLRAEGEQQDESGEGGEEGAYAASWSVQVEDRYMWGWSDHGRFGSSLEQAAVDQAVGLGAGSGVLIMPPMAFERGRGLRWVEGGVHVAHLARVVGHVALLAVG